MILGVHIGSIVVEQVTLNVRLPRLIQKRELVSPQIRIVHDVGQLIERIGELFRVRPVTVSEARVIGRDKMIAIGKPGEERLKHSR